MAKHDRTTLENERIRLMVIGVQKGGTTSLSNYLSEHPGLLSPLCVEFTYFTDDAEFGKGTRAYWDRFFPKGDRPGRKAIGKMSTLYHSSAGLDRLRDHAPDCHLALVLRDPVPRAYSAYRMACFDGWLTFDPQWLHRLLRTGPADPLYELFIGYGHYARYLEHIWKVFPKEQVHVFRFEDLQADPQPICNELFAAIGVAPLTLRGKEKVHNETVRARSGQVARFIHWLREEHNPLKRAVRNVMPYDVYLRVADRFIGLNRSSQQYPPMEPEVRAALADHYREHDARLAAMTGWDLSNWASQRG